MYMYVVSLGSVDQLNADMRMHGAHQRLTLLES